MSSPTTSAHGISVSVRGLRKSFDRAPVLQGVDFDVKPGEIFVIMGPSGCGKSVLLKHIIGLEAVDEGEVLIGGDSISTPGVMDKHQMAMVFQSGALLNSLTVGENVGLYLTEHQLKPSEEIAQIVAEKLELVGLKGREDRFPSELSGGMKKRVAIARALVIEPELLLYDEPTSELDPVMAVTIAEEIVELNRRTRVTSIVVTHDRDLAYGIADRIGIMLDGKLVYISTPEQVRNCQVPEVKHFLNVDFKFTRDRNLP